MMTSTGPHRRGLLSGLSALAAAAAGPAHAQARRDFVVATYGGLFESILRGRVIPDFERAHDVTVKLELGLGTTFIPKLLTSRRRSIYDIVYLNDDEAILGEDLGLWAPDQSARLAGIGDIEPNSKPPRLPLYGHVIHEYVLVYDPAKLAAPTSWADLWRPGLRVAVPHISNSYGIILLLQAALLNGGSETDFGPGFAALKRLAAMKIYRGVTQGVTLFQQGEVDAGLFHYSRAQLLKSQGRPIAWVRPSEGSWGTRTGVQIPKTAPNPVEALDWVKVILDAPYQAAFTSELYSPSNRRVTFPPDVASKLLTTAEIERIRFPDWHTINPQRDDLLSRWNRDFTG